MSLSETYHSLFVEKFSKVPFMVIAPGRINLIGEHTDYNDGFVMPAAVDKHIQFAVSKSESDLFTFYSVDYDKQISFRLDELKAGGQWINYLMGVVDGFKQRGFTIGGVDCLFGGNIPTGAGMSSSAALCCGFGFALNELFGCKLTRLELAHIAQRAEHEFAGVRCGIMDQYASLFGKRESALLLDCRSLEHEYLPFHFPEIEVLLIDTKVKHSLASSSYNDRRAACEEGVSLLQKKNSTVHSLRDVTEPDLETIRSLVSKAVFSKCQFVVREIKRTQQAANLLKANDLVDFGKLMFETHWGLSKEYEVSCIESDLLVEMAAEFPNDVLGARQMGGGFGGCIINLVRREAVEKYSLAVRKKYVVTFKKEPDFYSVNFSQGVHTI
ncbi:MAG: galactokinase [Cyclobacteriaceae bacterium]